MAAEKDGRTGVTQRNVLERSLSWHGVAEVAEGAPLVLSDGAWARIRAAHALVQSIVSLGIRAYGVNTGVGALCEVVVSKPQQSELSRNIVMSHAVGVGAALAPFEVRAIMAAAINNLAHGFSGVRPAVVERLLVLLAEDCIPQVPAAGSVGYLSHMAHIALVLIGAGQARYRGQLLSGGEALRCVNLEPLILEAKEGLSLVNGTPCASGLGAVAMRRMSTLLEWADAAAAMSFENLQGQLSVFDAAGLELRVSAGLSEVGRHLRTLLEGSGILQASAGRRTQDPLSLRAIPQVHGAARDALVHAGKIVDEELASVTDNPVVMGTVEKPRALSGANAVAAALALAADSLAIAMAEVAAMSERRMDRLLNPLVSELPAFLAADAGAGSGLMIAQYTAVALVADNRRLAAPASLDGGITSGLQEDHLSHATPAVLKLLKIIDNAQIIVAIELLAAAQAYDLQKSSAAQAPRTADLHRLVRSVVPHYRDDRPLGEDIQMAVRLVKRPMAV